MKKQSYYQDIFRRFRRNLPAMIGVAILSAEILLVIFLPVFLKLDPYTSHLGFFGAKPGPGHIWGFDDVGRDLFARVVYGGRTSLAVGLFATLISMAIGVPMGILAGYFRGIWETIFMRLSDIFMAFPAMILILVIIAVTGPSLATLIVSLGILSWTPFARLLYSKVLSIREEEYIMAAKAIGARNGEILLKYVLPNAMAPVLVQGTFSVANAMLAEAGISFLGLGVQPPLASWGNILYAAQSLSTMTYKPWVWIPPGVLFILTVLSINFIGDGLRQAIDTKSNI
jgi:peptide/nickel transport system permease protein